MSVARNRTIMRRVQRVRAAHDLRLIERKRAEELAAAEQLSAAEAEKRRMEEWLRQHYPDGRDPLWRSLEAWADPAYSERDERAEQAAHERRMREIRDELGGDEDDNEQTGRPIEPASNSRRALDTAYGDKEAHHRGDRGMPGRRNRQRAQR
jgi:hypothetical protein